MTAQETAGERHYAWRGAPPFVRPPFPIPGSNMKVLGLVGVAVLISGYDLQIFGLVAKQMLAEFGRDTAETGPTIAIFRMGVFGALALCLLPATLAADPAVQPRVVKLTIHDTIQPITADYLQRALDEAARQHAAADPLIAVRDRASHRKHDADDQAGLENFTENDDQRGKHNAALLHDQRAARGLLVVFVEKLVPAGFLRADIDDGVSACRDHLLDVQRLALEFHRLGIEIFQLDHDRRIGGSADFRRI